MPYFNVCINNDGATVLQIRQVVDQITRTLAEVLGKKPEHTHVVIDEVP